MKKKSGNIELFQHFISATFDTDVSATKYIMSIFLKITDRTLIQ